MFIEWVVNRFYYSLFPLYSELEDDETLEYQVWYLMMNMSQQWDVCYLIPTEERINLYLSAKKMLGAKSSNYGGIT